MSVIAAWSNLSRVPVAGASAVFILDSLSRPVYIISTSRVRGKPMNDTSQAATVRTSALTVKGIRARPVMLKLKRPVVARIATITEWPLILIDLTTEEGIVGRSYLEPYTAKAMKYLVPALHDLGDMLQGHTLSPVELDGVARKSVHFVGYDGLAVTAVSGREAR